MATTPVSDQTVMAEKEEVKEELTMAKAKEKEKRKEPRKEKEVNPRDMA